MSDVPEQHRRDAPRTVGCAVITVSDTRTPETDIGGNTAADLLAGAGHQVRVREIVPDEPERIAELLVNLIGRSDVDAVLLSGGTGLGRRDQTFETIDGRLEKRLPGFGELFRMLSYEQIGPAAMLSRATAGLVGQTLVISMPGSPAAVRLALEKLILPELGHLVREAKRS